MRIFTIVNQHGSHDMVEEFVLETAPHCQSNPPLLALFEGYDQNVMGGLNSTSDCVRICGIGLSKGTVTKITHQDGVVSIVSQFQ